MRWKLVVAAVFFLRMLAEPSLAIAETGISGATPNSSPVNAASLEIYIKVTGAAIGVLLALIGVPLAFLSYKKTTAEIAKIELETQALRQRALVAGDQDASKSCKSNAAPNMAPAGTSSPHDIESRILGALLLILNFITAWVFYTLSKHLLGFFDIGGSFFAFVLAAGLFLPWVSQSRHLFTTLKEVVSEHDRKSFLAAAEKQAKIIKIIYLMWCGWLMAFPPILYIVMPDRVAHFSWIGWTIMAIGASLLVLFVFVRHWIDRLIPKLF